MNCCVRAWLLVLAFLIAPAVAAPQELPPPRENVLRVADAPLSYVVQEPAGWAADSREPVPMILWCATGEPDRPAALARAGFVVVTAAATDDDALLARLFAALRHAYRIDQGGIHLAANVGASAAGVRLALAHAPQFQSVTLWGDGAAGELARLRPLRARRLQVLGKPDAAELVLHFRALHAAGAMHGAAGDVARTLDDFHDAAANADAVRYFAILPDDAVFLGTDASERWTGAEFKAFAMPYFRGDSAWTYVPLQRHVELAADGTLAWFDEVLDNDAYGECRGSGVLALRSGRWVLRQYNLTVPVPNELMRGTAARIRAFAAGRAPAVTTIVLVRHAEKGGDGDDPQLSDAGQQRARRLAAALRDLSVAAVYTSEFRRTASTVAPLCEAKELRAITVPARDGKALAARLQGENLGQTVVVCGHSNTLPALAKALGVAVPPTIGDDEYDCLLVVTLDADGARLLRMRYGDD